MFNCFKNNTDTSIKVHADSVFSSVFWELYHKACSRHFVLSLKLLWLKLGSLHSSNTDCWTKSQIFLCSSGIFSFIRRYIHTTFPFFLKKRVTFNLHMQRNISFRCTIHTCLHSSTAHLGLKNKGFGLFSTEIT